MAGHSRLPWILSCLIGPCLIILLLGSLQRDYSLLVSKARKFTLAAQQRHKHYYDAKHVPAVFAVNDEALLSTSSLNLKIAGSNKLAPALWGL